MRESSAHATSRMKSRSTLGAITVSMVTRLAALPSLSCDMSAL